MDVWCGQTGVDLRLASISGTANPGISAEADPVPMAVVTMTTLWEGAFDVIVQLDPESMERFLMNDEQIQHYTITTRIKSYVYGFLCVCLSTCKILCRARNTGALVRCS